MLKKFLIRSIITAFVFKSQKAKAAQNKMGAVSTFMTIAGFLFGPRRMVLKLLLGLFAASRTKKA